MRHFLALLLLPAAVALAEPDEATQAACLREAVVFSVCYSKAEAGAPVTPECRAAYRAFSERGPLSPAQRSSLLYDVLELCERRQLPR